MTINQILDEQMKEFDETKFSKGGGACFECCDYEGMYMELKSFIHSYTRMIIRSVAKELIGEDEDYRGHSAVNDFKAEQRLKVKEIITILK